MVKYNDVPILVHVGPHKTGTTWLQENIFTTAQGIVYDPSFELSHRAFLNPYYGNFDPEAARAVYLPMLERARLERKPLVISDEALSGWPFGQRSTRQIVAERIQLTFPQARILITVREQDAVLLSMYSEYLRYGFSSSLPAFLNQETSNPNLQPLLDLTYYEWDRVLDMYSSIFGPQQVIAVPMEWGISKPENYISVLETFLDARLGTLESQKMEKVARPALSGWSLSVLRRANMTRPHDTRHLHRPSRFSPNSLAYQVDRFTPKGARKRSKQAMKDKIDQSVGNKFTASNREFQKETNYDLAAFSYKT